MSRPAFPEYASHDGVGLAELVDKGEVTASELVEEALTRLERHNPTLNAVVYRMDGEARAAAEESDRSGSGGPLRGVPFVLKNLLGDYGGVPTTSGSRFLQGQVAQQDSELVVRYKRAGLIAVGKTNAPEFGLLPTTEPIAYGASCNPWSTAHSTGGSSGGSAACVAAGIVPIGHANDGGGSIRIPAACCGLVGLKPTRARNSLAPGLGDIMSGLVAEHVVTRSVRDSAIVLDCTAGAALGDPYWAPPQERPYHAEVTRAPGRLRIACWTQPMVAGVELDPACVEAVESTAALCAELGHEVTEARPEIGADIVTEQFMTLWAGGAAATIDGLGLLTGRAPKPELFEPLTWAFYEAGKQVTASQYLTAVSVLQGITRLIAAFHEDYDVWLTPTLGSRPLRNGEIDAQSGDIEAAIAPIAGYVPYTPIFNATGQPAISLPLHQSDDGLPIGVHFAGRFGDEGLLFRLAGQLEEARPWKDRRPAIWD